MYCTECGQSLEASAIAVESSEAASVTNVVIPDVEYAVA